MNNEEKIVNEFDRDGHHYKIGVKADGQVSVYLDDETKAHHGYHFPGVIKSLKELKSMVKWFYDSLLTVMMQLIKVLKI